MAATARNTGARGMAARAGALAAALLLALSVNACSETAGLDFSEDVEALPLLESGQMVRLQLEHGLEQTLELKPERLHPGDELKIRSVVRNVSNTYQKAEALVCHLEFRSDMDLQTMEPLILCLAYSMTVRLGPRDSLVLTGSAKVNSRPGRYTLIVRHILRPDIKARVRVNVYPRNNEVSESSGE
jgi:hypothetical protein